MCLIIASPNGNLPSEEYLVSAHANNDDGWGIVWFREGHAQVRKGIHLNPMLKAAEEASGHAFLLHYRLRTHGEVNSANTHPFKAGRDLWMAHNGILNIQIDHEDKSDSWHLAHFLKTRQYSHSLLQIKAHRDMLTEFCGKSNKLAFLSPSGLAFINEEAGYWDNGIWFSNRYSDPNYYTSSKSGGFLSTEFSNTWCSNYYKEKASPKATEPLWDKCEYCGHYVPLDEMQTAYGSPACSDCADWLNRIDSQASCL